jgi:hypothetical protein
MFHQQSGTPIHDACMAIIRPHPIRGIRSPARLQPNRKRRSLILRLPVESIVVAPVPEVQKTSRRRQKVECRLGIPARTLEHAPPLPRPLLGLFQVEQHRKPHRQVIVPQAARAILQIRFQMEDGIAELGVAGAGNLAQLLSDRSPLAQYQPRKSYLM